MDDETSDLSGDTSTLTSRSTASTTSYTRDQKIILISILLGAFFCCACISLPAPFLPKLNESHNINSDITGWVLGLLPLIQVILSPVFGKLLSFVPHHTMLVFGLFFCGGGTVLFGLLEYMSLPVTNQNIDSTYLTVEVIVRSSQAVGSAAFQTAAMTLLAISFPDSKTTVMSYSETAYGLGVMSGPAMGSGLYKLGGFMLTFGGVGGIMILISIVMYFIVPFTANTQNGQDEQLSLKQIFGNVNIILAMVVTVYCGMSWCIIDPILEPELRKKFGLTPEISALTFLLLSFTYSVMTPTVGRALDRVKRLDSMYVMVFGCLLSAVNMMVMGPSPLFPGLTRPLWLLIVCIGVTGIALGIVIVPTLQLSFPSSESGTDDSQTNTSSTAIIAAAWGTSYSFGAFVGSTLSGIITEHSSFGWTMTLFSFSSAAMAVLILLVKFYHYYRRRCSGRRETHQPSMPST